MNNPQQHNPDGLLTPAPRASRPPRMRTMTLIYHESLDDEITAIIRKLMVVARYTRIPNVVGARADFLEEQDYRSDGNNHMLVVIGSRDDISALTNALRTLRDTHGHGLRGYVTPVEEVI